MLRDVVVVGGSASLPGLAERLKAELRMIVPEGVQTTVNVRVWSAEKHSNDRSRGTPTAVTAGAEALLRAEGTKGPGWITAAEWNGENREKFQNYWHGNIV
ncbi:unnamed protein product [Sphacelaria rigidula]